MLLAISLWMRFKLAESPAFRAMKQDGRIARNPFVESFTYPGNKKRILVALFGVAAGLTVIWYTANFSALSFLKGPMRVDETVAEITVGATALVGMTFFLLFGALSDRIGRKKPIVWGYGLTLLALFPCFWAIGWVLEPTLQAAGPEMFPTRIRYSSMSIPYHIGTGYFGGFLPLIATAIVAETGDPYSGLWYTWVVVLMAFLVSLWGLPSGPPRDFADET